jgi:hypothetical protein
MAGLVPAIHVFFMQIKTLLQIQTWMPGNADKST